MKEKTKLVNKVKRLLRKIGCPRWLHHFGPKKYELRDHCFALLCKQLWQLSYRRITYILEMLGIKCPSKSALQYNAKRIPFALWQKLLKATTQLTHIAAIDSTGMARNIVSYHYLWRIDRDKPSAKPLKLSLAVDTAKKTVLSARVKSSFWSNDVKDMPYLINNMRYSPKIIVADKAYDSEQLHEYAHDKGIRAVIPLKKNAKRGFYRLSNAKRFRLRTYHRREIVESVISALKRKFGSYVRSRKIQTQRAEIFCRLILHNIFLCLYGLLGQSPKIGKIYINKVCDDMAMVKLIVYNIEYCEGMTGLWWEYFKFWKVFFPPKNLDQKIVDKIKKLKPDILALVEVDTGSFRSKKDEVVFFEKKLGMKSFAEQVKYPFQGWLKLFHFVPILNKQANAIIAKEKLSNVRYHILHEGTKRVVIEATIHVPRKVTLLLAHLSLGKKARAKQIYELIRVINNIKNPIILTGDFNTFNGEEEIENLLKETHLHHKFQMDVKSQTYTQPAFHPSRRLDYILTSKSIRVNSYEVLNFHFSDHLPILVDFKLV